MESPVRILVVDDEVNIVQVLETLLQRQGYLVRTAANGREALQRLQEEDFDVMVADIRMEPVDGLSLLSQALTRQPHLAVVMMTAYAAVETALQAMKRGAFDYICKPFRIEELQEIVDRAVSYASALGKGTSPGEDLAKGASMKSFLRDKELSHIRYVLEQCGGDRQKAAKELGISVGMLRRKLAEPSAD